jgi:hypothetical protein
MSCDSISASDGTNPISCQTKLGRLTSMHDILRMIARWCNQLDSQSCFPYLCRLSWNPGLTSYRPNIHQARSSVTSSSLRPRMGSPCKAHSHTMWGRLTLSPTSDFLVREQRRSNQANERETLTIRGANASSRASRKCRGRDLDRPMNALGNADSRFDPLEWSR